jgi:sigma-E factor negative regulatory protein RseB
VIIRFFLALLLSIGTARAGGSELDARDALTKMTKAMAELNYQGTVVFLKNGKLETMKYFHAVNKGMQQERLLSLNSPLREIVREADKVSSLFKTTQQIVVDHRPFGRSFLVDVPENLDAASAIYDFQWVGEENIALLPTYVIALEPKDDFRYGRKIWLERQQFLPLKVELYDLEGATLEQVVFTEFQVKDALPFVDVHFTQSVGAVTDVQHIHQLQAQSANQAAFVVGKLPAGFKELFFTRRPMHNSKWPVEHLLLSDGFASVSVYVENNISPGLRAEDRIHSMGAVNVFSKTVEDSLITVMGEVPAKTVKFIAEGIKLRKTQ